MDENKGEKSIRLPGVGTEPKSPRGGTRLTWRGTAAGLAVAGLPIPEAPVLGGGPGAAPGPGGPARFPPVPTCGSRRAPRGTPEVPPSVAMGTGGRRPEAPWKS